MIIIIIIIKGYIELKGKTIYNVALTVVNTVSVMQGWSTVYNPFITGNNNYFSSFSNFVR